MEVNNQEKTQNTNQSTSQGVREGRIQKLTDLVDMGVNPYPYTFDKTANAQTLQEKYKDLDPKVAAQKSYVLAKDINKIKSGLTDVPKEE